MLVSKVATAAQNVTMIACQATPSMATNSVINSVGTTLWPSDRTLMSFNRLESPL